MSRREAVAGLLVVAAVLVVGLGLRDGTEAHEVAARVVPPQATTTTAPAPTALPSTVRAPAPGTPDRTGHVRRAVALPGPQASDSPRSGSPRAVTTDPGRIVVPALSVDAPVVPIGAEGGVLVPPSDPTVIGWWSQGARPGATTGTAILTGHTVSSGGGAFDDLDLMRPGQRLRIVSGDAATAYVVRSVTVYRKQSLAEHAATIFDQDVPGRVALVTCEDWNGSVYLSNAVVIAEPTR